VFGLMTTAAAVSPGVSATEMLISLITLTAVYGVLAVVEVKLMLTYIKAGAQPFEELEPPSPDDSHDPDRPLAFAY
jgi:cytochrome d ubiquinol oxidase subunit I